MKLEQQVCSLELAKKLKELGVKQDSLFYWIGDGLSPDGIGIVYTGGGIDNPNDSSAFTVAELGEILPRGFYSYKSGRENDEHWCGSGVSKINYGGCKTEADVRAMVLVELIETGFISL